ncbi:glycosyltransferase family 2 protein [Limimaricola pyoseonensis]|uniref:Glycosyl transferase family 2 n=1 Tax=Limimaricola pyoseonensis TaxID=521013 RepID=A0A1G7J088_9RHOB|nr:glycosyltransferase family 2 protein [Limimaricola pyoseonensis]SDF18350.1 Glycosyl transferase family 2 [Limimaricola pyoseonensis]
MPDISVIIPTYNRRGYLREAIESVQAQTRPVREIIVWDDGSSDGTAEEVAEIAEPRLRYFAAANAGKSAALNRALAEARGDYIWICDDDDIALPQAAERLAGMLDADPGIGLAGAGYNRFRDGPGGREITDAGYWPDLAQGSVLRHLLEDIFLFQNATLVRRDCYDRVGPFRADLARSIDYDMIVRLAARYPVAMSEEVVFLQRKHDGARGPAARRHAASASEAVWAAQDRVVFEGLRPGLPLSLFEAMFEAEPEWRARAARLQRGAVYARRNDWGHAFDDLEAAARIAPDAPLAAAELAICRRAVSGKHGVVLSAPERRRLAALARQGRAGRQIAAGLGRGLLWSLRRAWHRRDRAEMLRLGRILAAAGLPLRPPGAGPALHERRALPVEAYRW